MIRALTIVSPIFGISARARRRSRRELQHFRRLRFTRALARRGSRAWNVAEKIARVRSGENLFHAVSRFEHLELASNVIVSGNSR
jgi:hypothetical protein